MRRMRVTLPPFVWVRPGELHNSSAANKTSHGPPLAGDFAGNADRGTWLSYLAADRARMFTAPRCAQTIFTRAT
jgi:hypothetical protein